MHKKILVDVNIFEDVLANRSGSLTSSEIIGLVKKGLVEGWISANSVGVMYYLRRKYESEPESRRKVNEIIKGFILIPLRNNVINNSFSSATPDFEDNIQIESAAQFHLDAIITRNKKDFAGSKIPAYTPEEFLNIVSQNLKVSSSQSHKSPTSQSLKIPFLDLKAQLKDVYNEIDDEITNIISNTAFVMGKPVFEFEKKFAEAHGAKYCHGVSAGTDGNHVVLWGLGVGPGDEVIIPANTFIATAWGATLCGATPVFVDCHPESYNIDPEKIVAAITPKTKAIVAVHLYGQPADMDGIKEKLKIKNYKERTAGVFVHEVTEQTIYVVEDAAQAHLAEYLTREIENEEKSNKNSFDNKIITDSTENKEIISRDKWKKVGGLGVASSFSFYPGKNLGAFGEAGAVMTNDEELARKFKMIRDHGAEQKYNHVMFGHNYRMSGIQGAVLGVKLKHLPEWTENRRRVAAKYRELLGDIEQIKLPAEMDYAKHVYHLFVIQVKSKKAKGKSEERDLLQKFLSENGIASGLHYPIPLHLQPCFAELGYKKGDFPVTEVLAEQGLSLPMYPELSDEQLEYISDKIHEFFK